MATDSVRLPFEKLDEVCAMRVAKMSVVVLVALSMMLAGVPLEPATAAPRPARDLFALPAAAATATSAPSWKRWSEIPRQV